MFVLYLEQEVTGSIHWACQPASIEAGHGSEFDVLQKWLHPEYIMDATGHKIWHFKIKIIVILSLYYRQQTQKLSYLPVF